MTKKSYCVVAWGAINIALIVGVALCFKTLTGIDQEAHVFMALIMMVLSTIPMILASGLSTFLFQNYNAQSTLVFLITWLTIGGFGYFQWFVLIPWLWRLLLRVLLRIKMRK